MAYQLTTIKVRSFILPEQIVNILIQKQEQNLLLA